MYLSVDIEKWKKRLLEKYSPCEYKWIWFDEPDLGNRTTAIAIYPNDFPEHIRRKLSRLPLLK